MKLKKIFTTGLFFAVVSLLLIIPNYPSIMLMDDLVHQVYRNADISIESSNMLKGDIAYVKAIIDRSDVTNGKTQKESSETEVNRNIPQLVYFTPAHLKIDFMNSLKNEIREFFIFHLPSVYLKIPSPPPKAF